ASLLDEAPAVAEAVQMMARGNTTAAQKDGGVLLAAALLPSSFNITRARAAAVDIAVEIVDVTAEQIAARQDALIGVVVSNPGTTGGLRDDLTEVVDAAHAQDALVTVACDLLAQVLVTSPGESGADIAVGSAQRFGVPLFFGGPHAAFLACRESMQRKLPGRIVGVSVDAEGTPAYRLSLQTREQHIRRDKATSNICTAQALLAVAASFYAVWHGPQGLREIATAVHGRATALAVGLSEAGFALAHDRFFDTVTVQVPDAAATVAAACGAGFNLRHVDEKHVGISVGESTTDADVAELLAVVAGARGSVATASFTAQDGPLADLLRTDDILTHPVFHSVSSETQMMRYMRRLAGRDLALDRTMIPLGSCTMKLNAAVSMEPITWPEFAGIPPMVPEDQATGWLELIDDLEDRLAKITGYAAVSVQPNAGSQGELAGLLALRRFHVANGDDQRTLVLIPASAHGTNAASAALAGLKVVGVKNADDGSIDLDDLDAKIAKYGEQIAGIMITYPSTHGVFEEHVRDVCAKVHDAGGQVYIDGANLNALVGLAQPGEFGGDVSHLNLHKTFTIPHGGGGPGVGPVCVGAHLVPFLPSDPWADVTVEPGVQEGRPVSQANQGSAGVLPISWTYIAMMGDDGRTEASRMALGNAHYISN
ncbi:MAG: beta-eliminating lyase-related protein, partial [Corynebacterium sp.]|nr:beta-eliminating lyase-related protein [Corynebacterium sp.]